jgi:N-acetylglucosaminyldiphosphoundecaprenol N-acetyl-beta-D-mannosaminyltransferase
MARCADLLFPRPADAVVERRMDGGRRFFAGLAVSPLRHNELVELVVAATLGRHQLSITFLNPDYARRAFLDDHLRNAINHFDYVLVDGNGVRLMTPLFGFIVPERLDTDAVAPHIFRALESLGGGVYLFGCAPGVAERARLRLAVDLPKLRVAGTEHGYFDVDRGHPGHISDDDSVRIIDEINATGPDLLLVSLPTPLQQEWVMAYRDQLQVPVVMTAGSYLDHLAQSRSLEQPWYPGWATTLRLNWLHRLIREPSRLWRRYTLEIAQFTYLVILRRLRRV